MESAYTVRESFWQNKTSKMCKSSQINISNTRMWAYLISTNLLLRKSTCIFSLFNWTGYGVNILVLFTVSFTT